MVGSISVTFGSLSSSSFITSFIICSHFLIVYVITSLGGWSVNSFSSVLFNCGFLHINLSVKTRAHNEARLCWISCPDMATINISADISLCVCGCVFVYVEKWMNRKCADHHKQNTPMYPALNHLKEHCQHPRSHPHVHSQS